MTDSIRRLFDGVRAARGRDPAQSRTARLLQAGNFRAAYAEWGHGVILHKGQTPIPNKIVTITSGFAAYDLFWFTVLSIITRGARFYAVALLLYVWGDWAREFIERRLELLTTLFAILLVGGFAAVYFLF